MRGDLAGRFLAAAVAAHNDLVAAALGDLTHEYRENRVEALARNIAEGLGTPTIQFGESIMKLLLIAKVAVLARCTIVLQGA
jgi:hypothetical protein